VKKLCPVCHTEHDLIRDLCDSYDDLFFEQVAWRVAALGETREEAEAFEREWFKRQNLPVTV
jgi:hypothetical protein